MSAVWLRPGKIWLAFAWMGAGTITAGRGLVQYARDIAAAHAAHQEFYRFYIADRIRGFMSHWMTFSGQELFVLLLLLTFVLFGQNRGSDYGSAFCARLLALRSF